MLAHTKEMTVKARDAILADMAPVTREAALEGAERLRAGHKVMVLLQYHVGAIVGRIFDSEDLDETQKREELRKLAAYWNQPHYNPSTLYDLRNVADAFTYEFVQSQMEERMANGASLTWSHFKELQKIGDEKRQLAVLKKIRQNCWSANELALELQGKKEAAIQRSGGRKPMLPKTPNAMLQKMNLSAQQTDNFLTAMFEPLESVFLQLPADEFDNRFVENIATTRARMSDLQQHLQQAIDRLDKVTLRAQEIVTPTLAVAAKKAAPKPAAKQADIDVEVAEVMAPVPARKLPRRSGTAS